MKKTITALLVFAIYISGCASTKPNGQTQMYRVAWKDHLTMKEGHGEWMADRQAAKASASQANAQYSHIVHWVESKYKKPTTKYYVQDADLTVKNGKPTFMVKGEKKPLTDTVIRNIYLITIQ